MVKFTFEISKKILPTASIFTLAVVVTLLGTVIDSVPSLGVLASSTMGNVLPPSVDKLIFTFAQFTGAAFELFTLQVMVCEEPGAQVTAVLGAVTAKGPAVAEMITCISSLVLLPPPLWLSRAVNRKLSVRATEGSTSHLLVLVPPSMEARLGKVRAGTVE